MTQHRPVESRYWAAIVWDPATDWETVDLVWMREQCDAELVANCKATREWLDQYGDAAFDAALSCVGVLRGNETVASVMVTRGIPQAARGDETGDAL
jgi:hypothetical protein